MKKSINLFQQKARVDVFAVFEQKIKMTVTVLGIIFFCLFCYLVYLTLGLTREQQALDTQKATYLQYLLSEKDNEANMRYFKSKETQLNTFLKDDAHFLPYYKILKDSIDATNTSTTLDTIQIDKDRNTTFIVRFANYDQMLTFLRNIESSTFLGNFTSLTLDSFDLSAMSGKENSFQLELKGVFKEIPNA
jgi:hypothetical protein